MEILITNNDGETTITLIGRIDTANSTEFDAAIAPIVASDMSNVVLDCEKLSYISSSGLRIFLTLQKTALAKKGHLRIRNMNSEIKNVFNMTGFSKLFQFE